MRLDSQREAANLRFRWQGQHFQGFADFADAAKIDRDRQKIAPTMLRKRAVRKKNDFCAPGCHLVWLLVAPDRSRTLLGALFGVLGCPWGLSGRSRGTPGTSQDAPEALPRRLRNAPGRHGTSETDFDSILGAPEPLPGPILDRFPHNRHSHSSRSP